MYPMPIQQKVESVLRRITALPEEAQAEILRTLVEVRSQNLGIDNADVEERAESKIVPEFGLAAK